MAHDTGEEGAAHGTTETSRKEHKGIAMANEATLMETAERELTSDIGKITPVSWKAPADMSFDDWERVGNTLQTIQGSINWWIGDWLNEGEQRWGEMYAQAVETTGWDYNRLADAKYVASKVQFSLRNENLSWSKHRAVAKFDSEEQAYWLARAESEHWNTHQLRDAIKHAKQLETRVQERVNGNGNGHHEEPLPGDYEEPAEYYAALYSAEGNSGDQPDSPEDSFDDWQPPESQDKMAVHYSSETGEWETPQALFDLLDREFRFDLDVCALPENAKCRAYFSPDDDGLTQDWYGTCWMNPPYGKEIKNWIAEAWRQSQRGATVVCLVPARVDTSWWWDYCIKGEIRFLRGRLKFGNAEHSAPFPSAVVIFAPHVQPSVCWWEEGSHV